MKIRNFIIITFTFFLLTACEDVMEQKVNFEVKVEAGDYLQFTDTNIVAPAGSKIKFNFEGEPDFISFSYERFLPTNATLKFATQAAWGTHAENTLKVYLSSDFEGLKINDFDADSASVANHNWTDISELCNLPSVVNQKRNAEIPINDYRGKNMVAAFRYKTSFVDDWQPAWTISDLLIQNTRITDGSNVSTYLAATMGFTPFDIFNRANAYRNEYVTGVWSATNAASMQIRQTARNNPLNDDWLISMPIAVPRGLTESSTVTGVKNTTLTVDSYIHTFSNVGEYEVSFRASNHNYRYQSSVVKTIKIVITD